MSEIKFVIVTGLSGAGKSQAIHSLEDLGFFCVDNLPPDLIPKFAEICRQTDGKVGRIAVVVDIRGGEFFGGLRSALAELVAQGLPYQIVFLEANDETLVRRFKETRRRHPLVPTGRRLLEGIKEERRRLAEARDLANLILDTSGTTPVELRRKLGELLAEDSPARFPVQVVTFGFKHGLPLDADLVFDVRFLPNPYYVEDLCLLPGTEVAVREYVLKWPATRQLLEEILRFLDFLFPQYIREGKSQLVVAVGCTGGRHRSVVVGEYLADAWRKKGFAATVEHRDVERADTG